MPLGDHSWLTVVAPDDQDVVQLLLEPDQQLAVRAAETALVADGIPWTSFSVRT